MKNYSRLFLILLCSGLFAIPLVTIIYQAVTVLDAQIKFAQREEYGVQYHSSLLDFEQHFQEFQGLTFLARNDNATARTMLEAHRSALLGLLGNFEKNEGAFGKVLGAEQDWQKIDVAIRSLLKEKPSSPLEEYLSYSKVSDSILSLLNNVSDSSNLSLDPEQDSSYRATVLVDFIPKVMATLGEVRNMTSGMLAAGVLPGHETPEQMRELQAHYNNVNDEDYDLMNSLQRAQVTVEKVSKAINYHEDVIKPKLGEFKKNFKYLMFQHTETLPPQDFFALTTQAINTYDTLYDDVSEEFLVLLKHRQATYTTQKNLILISSAIAFLGFATLFFFLYRALIRAEQTEEKLKQYAEELEGARIRADSASVAKSEFLANMSHELRTPLNSILGMTRLLLDTDIHGESRELASTVMGSSVNLLQIVNDILDLSKIEAGEMTLEKIGFDITYIFDSVAQRLKHLAQEKQISMTSDFEKDSFPYVLGDPLRVTHVLTNLIGNAIKYTDKGEVSFRAFCRKIDNKYIELRCEIKDTGIGIPEDKLQIIFEKFGQADTSTTRKYGGTGLGLAITKQLVELMGGKISVDSEIGVGSTFWFSIPLEVTDELNQESRSWKNRKTSGTIPVSQARVLVAEDHPVNQIFAKKVLEKFNIGTFEVVENGQQALEKYKKESWDVILIDGHMPEMNGYDATAAIRQLEKTTGRHIPIVAMTANAMIGEKEKCLRYGMDDYISKPIDIDELKDILSQWLLFDEAAISSQQLTFSDVTSPIDLTQMRTFTDGDEATEKELVAALIQQSEINVKILKENAGGENPKAWAESAHMMKGGVSTIGAIQLQKLCHEAQNFTGTAEQRTALFQKILEEYERVKAQLQNIGLLSS